MTPFEFVAVFFSLLVGLGIAHLLAAISDLVEVRSRVRMYWVHSVWVVVVLLVLVHAWWGMWPLQDVARWTYPGFLAVVGYMAALYLLSTLVLPRARDEGIIDLAVHFEEVRPVFMTVLAVTAGAAVPINHVLFGSPLISYFTLIPAAFTAIALVGVRVANRRYQAFAALFFLIAFIGFMALDTTTLE